MAQERKPLMAGNWKMNLNHLEAIALVQKLAFALKGDDYDAVDVAVLPPFTDIRSIQTLVDGDKLRIEYGAQDISEHDSGAYTGEIAGSMLAKLGCSFATVGHSERRQYHNENDEVVNAKAKAALKNGITPIICVGEGLDVRQEGNQVQYTLAQVDGALDGLTAQDVASSVVAYEPVWAIGTGEVATPEDAQEVCAAIRARLADLYDDETAQSTRILYGGSVKPDNVAGIMAMGDVDGGLVGGASIDPDDFVALIRYRLLTN
ncbi:MAG: triose-phosphate isomerase [Candidatus Nanopelagicales bacterium]